MKSAISNEKLVPKICNVTNFAYTSDGSVLMTFLYKDPDPAMEAAVLLERILVNKEHATKMRDVLNNILTAS